MSGLRERDWDFDLLTEQFAKKMIYFVGNARGGSTVSNAALGIHPRLLEVRWNDIIFTKLWPIRTSADDAAWRELLLRPPHYYDPEKATARIGEAGVQRLDAHVDKMCTRRTLRETL